MGVFRELKAVEGSSETRVLKIGVRRKSPFNDKSQIINRPA